MAVDPNVIINNAIATADAQVAAAGAAAEGAITASQGAIYPSYTPFEFTLLAAEPVVPDVENSTFTYETQRDKLIALLSDELANFFIQYYPLASDAFDEATNWLVNMITVGGTGIAPALEEQLFQRGKDRVIADGLRAEAQTLNEFAARGHVLPTGVLAGRLQETRFEGMTKIGGFARDVSIRMAELAVENVRFAVEQAIKSRMAAMDAAVNYIRALMTGPDVAARVASINSDAKARMMAATADLYRARLARDELAMKIPIVNKEEGVKVTGIAVDAFTKHVDARVAAAGHAATVYGQAAQAALSSLVAMAGTSQSSFG